MTRKTSIETYRQIEAEGLLSKRRMEVYRVLYKHGPMTYSQMLMKFRDMKDFATSSTYQARLSELREAGVVEELGTVICPITNRNVILWSTNDKLPGKKKLMGSRRAQIMKKILKHRQAIRALERTLEKMDRKPDSIQTGLFEE